MYCLLINDETETIRSLEKWTKTGFVSREIDRNNISELPFKKNNILIKSQCNACMTL